MQIHQIYTKCWIPGALAESNGQNPQKKAAPVGIGREAAAPQTRRPYHI